MSVEIEWDDAAVFIALLQLHVPARLRLELQRQVVASMRSYDGQSTGGMPRRMTRDIKARVEFWKQVLR